MEQARRAERRSIARPCVESPHCERERELKAQLEAMIGSQKTAQEAPLAQESAGR